MPIKVLLRDYPRAVALATDAHVLIFRHSLSKTIGPGASTTSLGSQKETTQPQCMVEFSSIEKADLSDFRSLTSLTTLGTLGLITVNNDVFLCVVSGASRVATVKPGENVQQITSVEFHCINRSDHDYILHDQLNRYQTDYLDEDGYDTRHPQPAVEHPCLALKKLLSGGSFYFSADFDLTRRVQDRSNESATIALDSLDRGFLWNAYMIQPLVSLRSRLSDSEKEALDESRILTSAIRGFALTITVPAPSSPVSTSFSGLASSLTIISRLSCRRAGTRFNARGIDDDGNVANFVETETAFWAPTGLCFSYVQIRGSVPVFWEQAAGFTPSQQKIHVTRSVEATQPAFDRHFSEMEATYGAVHIVNLLSNEKSGEIDLTKRYQHHVRTSPLNEDSEDHPQGSGRLLLRETDYDFHAETRGQGYEAASGIKRWIDQSAESFVYYLSEEVEEEPKNSAGRKQMAFRRTVPILQQEGIFRTNCLDCLDRTNLVQTIISQMAIEELLRHRGERRSSPDFWIRHSTLWADNGDALSKIYAGTGALKSSFTRTGKMSFAGAIADVRKSATRLYINNFEDKGRQNNIDMLLGRLVGQTPAHLFDPINDYVSAEVAKRTAEYSSSETIRIFVGTLNLNGKHYGLQEDLSPWLCPPIDVSLQLPEIVAVGFQEIVELSPQQIMSTDPDRRILWEDAVKKTLNTHAQRKGSDEYIILRGGQLVGASLSVFVKSGTLPKIKNVEGSLKKTGMSGMAGNKGAVAIRMEVASTSICFVTAHLAAGFANYEERNQDYRTISAGLRFQRNRSIEDHDTIIWLGDFNYRIGMNNDRARNLIKQGDLMTLYENDQLNLQMVHGKTFPHYSEAHITFPPTYKYNNGTDEYDTSEKARIPAWTDRVLSKGNNLRQIDYDTAPLRFSDHRPVYATFRCTISIVDEKIKERISNDLYLKRRATLAKRPTTDLLSDDDEPGDFESVEPGLPPASSDRRRWWLDGGLPARSRVEPPSNGHALNPDRASNPFGQSTEPDWVKIDRLSSGLKPTTTNSNKIAPLSGTTRQQQGLPSRKLPPPLDSLSNGERTSSDAAPPPMPPRTSISSQDSSASRQSLLRKPAPPVPQKPQLLRGESNASVNSNSSTITGQRRVLSSPAERSSYASEAPSPPPPRRSGTSGSTIGSSGGVKDRLSKPVAAVGASVDATAADEARNPPLPPRKAVGGGRTTSQNIMDEKDGEMKGWEPLRPG